MTRRRYIHYHPSIPDLTPEEIESFRADFIKLCPEPSEVYWNEDKCRYTARPGRAKQMTMKYHYLFVGFILGQREKVKRESVIPPFPQDLTRKWTGAEVQDWIDKNIYKKQPFEDYVLDLVEMEEEADRASEPRSGPRLFGDD